MTVHSERLTEELEEKGRVETEVIGLKYTGEKSSAVPNEPRRRGGWPGRTPFQRGRVQIGVNPDWLDDTVSGGSLNELEILEDWEVIYDPAPLAESLLTRNYLPPIVFGGHEESYSKHIRSAVFEKLGLEDAGQLPEAEDDYREQLAEIAGVDYEPTMRDDNLEAEFKEAATRSQALEAADRLEMDVDMTTPKLEAIEYLTEQEEAEARQALRDAGVEFDTEV